MVDEDDGAPLESRTPTLEDLIELCRRLNEEGAEYVVVGVEGRQTGGSSRPAKLPRGVVRPGDRIVAGLPPVPHRPLEPV